MCSVQSLSLSFSFCVFYCRDEMEWDEMMRWMSNGSEICRRLVMVMAMMMMIVCACVCWWWCLHSRRHCHCDQSVACKRATVSLSQSASMTSARHYVCLSGWSEVRAADSIFYSLIDSLSQSVSVWASEGVCSCCHCCCWWLSPNGAVVSVCLLHTIYSHCLRIETEGENFGVASVASLVSSMYHTITLTDNDYYCAVVCVSVTQSLCVLCITLESGSIS